MEPAPARPRHEAIDDDVLVHEWRVRQLIGLGIPGRWPRPPPTTSTGTRSPRWCAAAARRGYRSDRPVRRSPWLAAFPSSG